MKREKRKSEDSAAAAAEAGEQTGGVKWWIWAALAAAAAAAYAPAMNGPFLFDDLNLPMMSGNAGDPWISFVKRGIRAATNLSLLANKEIWGLEPGPYHWTNLLLHLANGWLVFRILKTLLRRAGRAEAEAAYGGLAGGALFLLHPLQTEAVAYIASRSEVLCALFSYAACLVFLSDEGEVFGWGRTMAVLALLGFGLVSKEPAVAMAGVFVLADVWMEKGMSFRRVAMKWKLYLTMGLGGLAAGLKIYSIASREGSAGTTAGVGAADYLVTQFKVVWLYLKLAVVPWGQNLDHAYPVTKAPGDAVAWLGLVGLVAVVWAAFRWRARYPVATLGALAFLILLTPTSSVLPIADTMAERRVYLGSIGLAALAAEAAARMRRDHAKVAAGVVVLAVLGVVTMARVNAYTSAEAMWTSSVRANPANARAQFQLADAYYREGRCKDALGPFSEVEKMGKADYRFLVNYAMALDCAGSSEAAIVKLRQATGMERNAHAWAVLGMVYGKRRETEKALEALGQALEIEPSNEVALVYRGNVRLMGGEKAAALADYEAVLRMNPANEAALRGREAAR